MDKRSLRIETRVAHVNLTLTFSVSTLNSGSGLLESDVSVGFIRYAAHGSWLDGLSKPFDVM